MATTNDSDLSHLHPPPLSHTNSVSKMFSTEVWEEISNLSRCMQHTKEEIYEVKANILVIGIEGVGKSTIVKKAFGSAIKHEPQTELSEYFVRYGGDRVILYDSKGFREDNYEEFFTTAKSFYEQHQKKLKVRTDPSKLALEDAIHCLWYIVDASKGVLHDFEAKLCKEVFHDLPVIFILNKVDLVSDTSALRQQILDLEMENLVDIFDVNGERRKGLSKVARRTLLVLPELAGEAFIAAQKVDFQRKEEKSQQIIRDFVKEFDNGRTTKSINKYIVKMIIRLSVLWNFREHSVLYASELAHKMLDKFGFKDRLFLLLHQKKKEIEKKFYATAYGILWYRCVKKVNKVLLKEFCEDFERDHHHSSEGVDSNNHFENTLTKEIDECFTDFTDDNLVTLEKELENDGLDKVLRREQTESAELYSPLTLRKTWGSELDLKVLEAKLKQHHYRRRHHQPHVGAQQQETPHETPQGTPQQQRKQEEEKPAAKCVS